MKYRHITNNDLENIGFNNLKDLIKNEYLAGNLKSHISGVRNTTYMNDISFTFTCSDIWVNKTRIVGFRSYPNKLFRGDVPDTIIMIIQINNSFNSFCISTNCIGKWRVAIVGSIVLDLFYKKGMVVEIFGLGAIGSLIKNYLNISRIPTYTVKKNDFKSNITKYNQIEKNNSKSKVYIISTNSKEPVLKYNQLGDYWRIIHIGSKYKNNTDLDPSIYLNSDLIITDNIDEFNNSTDFCFNNLSALELKECFKENFRLPKKVVFCSQGLQGSDLLLTYQVIEKWIKNI